MGLFLHNKHCPQPFLCFLIFLIFKAVSVSGATFMFINKCDYTVWPGIYGKPELGTTGFELTKATSRTFQAPTGWSGRFWGRTGCQFDSTGHGTCSTADCGSGEISCNGATASPPATLAEFTLGTGSMDFYDVSLVDGYNLPMMVTTSGGTGSCEVTGCSSDLNLKCPSELKVEGGGACNSACGAFGKPEYCCNGAFSNPDTCHPSVYSQMFKAACPKAYSYAYDDGSSTFTCSGADYSITFCPTSSSRFKRIQRELRRTNSQKYHELVRANQFAVRHLWEELCDYGLKSAADSSTNNTKGTSSGSRGGSEQSEMANDAWMAYMATASGASTTMVSLLVVVVGFIFSIYGCFVFPT